MSRRGYLILICTALALRLVLLATTFGTTDAFLFTLWAELVDRFGIAASYLHAPYLNHSPLVLALLLLLHRLARTSGLLLSDLLRLLQIAADCATALLLLRLGRRLMPDRAREISIFFFASPAAIFLSGFHCNVDPLMMALLLAALYTSSGVLFALSASVKIAPLPLAPFFLLDMAPRRRMIFLVTATITMAMIFVPAMISGGTAVAHNIFGYSGSGYEWGFCGLGYLTGSRPWAELYAHYGRYVVIAALMALFVFFLKRPTPLPVMLCVALLTMNFFAPGFGVQYLVWPLPFLLFALPRTLAYVLNAALSLFLFATYTIWAHGFPWWFADAAAPNPLRPLVALLAFPLWILYGVAIVAALRRDPRQDFPSQHFAEGRAGD